MKRYAVVARFCRGIIAPVRVVVDWGATARRDSVEAAGDGGAIRVPDASAIGPLLKVAFVVR